MRPPVLPQNWGVGRVGVCRRFVPMSDLRELPAEVRDRAVDPQARRRDEPLAVPHAQPDDVVAGQLGALKVRLATRAGDSGRLFGSVTTGDIADAVKAAGGPVLDRRRIEIVNPIKSVGSHRITVKLHPEVSASLDVEVVAD